MAEGLAEIYRKLNDARDDEYRLNRYNKQAVRARKAALTTDDKPLQAFTLNVLRHVRKLTHAHAKRQKIKARNAQLTVASP